MRLQTAPTTQRPNPRRTRRCGDAGAVWEGCRHCAVVTMAEVPGPSIPGPLGHGAHLLSEIELSTPTAEATPTATTRANMVRQSAALGKRRDGGIPPPDRLRNFQADDVHIKPWKVLLTLYLKC